MTTRYSTQFRRGSRIKKREPLPLSENAVQLFQDLEILSEEQDMSDSFFLSLLEVKLESNPNAIDGYEIRQLSEGITDLADHAINFMKSSGKGTFQVNHAYGGARDWLAQNGYIASEGGMRYRFTSKMFAELKKLRDDAFEYFRTESASEAKHATWRTGPL